jgi:hypothetical protein
LLIDARTGIAAHFCDPKAKGRLQEAQCGFALSRLPTCCSATFVTNGRLWRSQEDRDIDRKDILLQVQGCQPLLPTDKCCEPFRFGNATMNEYQVTYANGVVVEIEAWTPEVAQAIAEEDAEQDGRIILPVVSVELLAAEDEL